ncbi:hypothetical protein M409DRAFT_29122 [Zasmidium cellare ATCC 36951]|uniref:Uncharacterized protein n=1 Tax=Zasmidium cellare ATCC 36951 TaxID=1080233 RepID=A0A6A6C0G3_ZASCE|nr:uncharacterized protein M409DRAFT_29122 [Zasmidium cellare ATCC 36951]KAF2160501.1 hypothetical protein M409DRAFT_29122 [Zasmidium cellare ATCC 36951]
MSLTSCRDAGNTPAGADISFDCSRGYNPGSCGPYDDLVTFAAAEDGPYDQCEIIWDAYTNKHLYAMKTSAADAMASGSISGPEAAPRMEAKTTCTVTVELPPTIGSRFYVTHLMARMSTVSGPIVSCPFVRL